MQLQRVCKVCLNEFTAIKTTQHFCQRKCFKRDYYLRNKEKQQAENAHPTFPTRACAYCDTVQMIPYDPIKNSDKFKEWECVNCGVTNALLWKYQDNPRSHKIITALLTSVHMTPFVLEETVTIRATFITIMGGSQQSKLEAPKVVRTQQQYISTVSA